ncbi:integrase [Sphingobium sp. B1D7B]|uniref:tyrosine-type recombinase/integrase n=1 Tax=Sphingobium sp. B1D7B TaxID=2940578 RepID=UPI00222500E7|nr:tyrosine-type recombinase/integrase [Sphingobium sp. B1D7B]MCW2405088.1 integrase [Sphingobium sp. B1D7B]
MDQSPRKSGAGGSMTYATSMSGQTRYLDCHLMTWPESGKVTGWPTESRGASSVVRTDLPFTYVSRKKLKSGWRDYWYFRRYGVNLKLPGRPGDPKFHARYAELLDERKEPKPERHTVSWLVGEYRKSPEFRNLKETTRVDYSRTLDRIVEGMGPERYDCVNRAAVRALRDVWADQPRTGNKIKQMTSRLYTWADECDLVPEGYNPAEKLKKLREEKRSIPIWSDEEIDLFLSNCPGFLKTAVLLAVHTGQRRADIAKMDWRDVQGDMIRVRQEKTGEPLMIAMHPDLKAHLLPLKKDLGRILRSATGMPMDDNKLSGALNRAVAALPAMPHRSWHGLRYAAAGRLEAAGCSVVEITSVIGHRTYQMALKYARQRKDSERARDRLSA